MNLPKSVNIGPYTIPVDEDPKPIDEDGREVFGWFDSVDYKILIAEGMPPVKKLDTFVHEIVEGINEIADLQLNHTQIQVLGMLMSQALGPSISGERSCNPEPLAQKKHQQFP